ncbi:MAG: hypothetical protein KAH95_10010 [Spirochaetales bacterium]|nr:hypothetical protein [Spirochaetales bacterium]
MLEKSLFVFLVFCTTLLPLYSNDVTGNVEEEPEYIIRNVSYTIDGKTRERVLKHYLDIKSGESFVGESELLTFLDDKQKLINNQRTLAGGSIVTSYSEDPKNPEIIFVDLEVFVKDTWNYILLPYANYNSNDGFLLSLRARNYSFFGSMEKLSMNLDYLKPNNEKAEYSINGGFKLPFYLGGYNWKFSFDEDLTVSPDAPVKVITEAGIAIDIPLNSLTWQASIDQEYYLNEDGETDEDGYYMRTAARFGSSIPTGLNFPYLGEVTYTPGIISSYAYKPFGTLSEDRKGYEIGGEHGALAGQVNWYENFRDGIRFSVDQNLRYNYTRELWKSDQEVEIQLHKFFGWGGISSRVQGFYLYNGADNDIEEIGEPIRGILNDRINGNAGLFINLDFPVKIWIWFLDRWFEGHISPFFDYALIKPEGGDFTLTDGWYGAGVEGFAFLKAARSIYLRFSLGVDLEAVLDGKLPGDRASRDGEHIYELSLGLGHHY